MPEHHPLLVAYWGLSTPAWAVMWAALGLLTVALLVFLRSRWSQQRTWQKCAVLSLWVHILLAFFSTTVCIITGAPQAGDGEPIRVSVVTLPDPILEATEPEEEIQPLLEELTAPPLAESEPDEPEVIDEPPPPDTLVGQSDEAEPAELSDATPLAPRIEAPALLPAPPPQEVAEVAEQESSEPDDAEIESESAPTRAESAPRLPTEAVADREESESSPWFAETTPPENESPPDLIPEKYADRLTDDLTALATQGGGSAQTEQAVRAALVWLAAAQSENGGWDASKYGAGQERAVLGHNRLGAGANADTGVTGLAVLAFLGAGHSHTQGDYRTEVAHALEYLRQRQRADGSLAGDAELYAQTYCHSMATLAVCEAYAMTRDQRLDSLARRAVAYSLSLQHPTDGGWRYRRGDTGDTSQLGWQLMSLESARLAGIEIPAVAWTRVQRFLKGVQHGSAGGRASYRPDGPPSRTMTAEAWYCHQLLGVERGSPLTPAAIEEAVASLSEELPTTSRRNLYYWYYATLALHQNQHHSAGSLAAWENWNQALTTVLLTTQDRDGSWDTNTVWGGYGGQIYTTSLSALCLEVYYRYHLGENQGEIAGREDWTSRR